MTEKFTEEWLLEHQSKMHSLQSNRGAEPARVCVPTLEYLISVYNIYADNGRLDELASQFGLHKTNLCRLARKHGLTNQRRTKPFLSENIVPDDFMDIHQSTSDGDLAERYGVSKSTICEWRKVCGLKKDPSLVWKNSPHPRGATGLVASESHRKKLSESSKRSWSDPHSKVNSDEFRQGRSDRMMISQKEGKLGPAYSRGLAGRRPDIGAYYFRSSWEANYARYLNFLAKNGSIHKWEYESDTFWFEKIKRGIRSYKPDFKIWETDVSDPYYVEVKGYFDAKSKTKIKRMRIYFPTVRVVLFDSSAYKALSSKMGRVIPNWEGGRL